MIVSDSSSIVLLAKTNTLYAVLKGNVIHIPEKVYDESVKAALEKGHPDAYIINEAVMQNHIKIIKAKPETAERIQRLFGISRGENETVSVAIDQNAELVLSDDKKCIRVCASLGIPYATTPDIIVALYRKKRLSKENAKKSLENLRRIGWYKKDIIDQRMEVIL